MATLAERITADTTAALKEHAEVRLSTLRMLRSDIKYVEIANMRPATDDDVLAVIRKGIKQRQEAIELYERGGRSDVADKERAEIEILQAYLPATLDTETIRQVVRDVITQTGATGPSAIGIVMRTAMEQLRNQADGRTVQAIAREELAARGG